MTRLEARAEIFKKYKTISRFARLADIDRYELQKILGTDSTFELHMKRIIVLIKRTPVKITSNEVDPKKMARVKRMIAEQGGMAEFCRVNEFNYHTVRQILQGRRKLMSPVVTRLFEFF